MAAELLQHGISEHLTDPEWRPSGTTTSMSARATLSAMPRVSFMGRQFLVTVGGTPPPWVVPTIERIDELLSLTPNWDSYGAPGIDPVYVDAALRLLLDVMQENTPAPSMVPTSRGGIQLEWHAKGIDLEVELVTPSQVHGFYEDARTGASWEADLTVDVKRLTEAITVLSRQ